MLTNSINILLIGKIVFDCESLLSKQLLYCHLKHQRKLNLALIYTDSQVTLDIPVIMMQNIFDYIRHEQNDEIDDCQINDVCEHIIDVDRKLAHAFKLIDDVFDLGENFHEMCEIISQIYRKSIENKYDLFLQKIDQIFSLNEEIKNGFEKIFLDSQLETKQSIAHTKVKLNYAAKYGLVTVKKPGNDMCAICIQDQHIHWVNLKCNHKFHSKCIQTWLHKNIKCPICRQQHL